MADNYKFAPSRVPDPAGMIRDLKDQGFRISLWQLPYFTSKNQIYDEAVKAGYVVRNDGGRVPYEDAILDFSNGETVRWYQGILAELLKAGVGAIKVDFGEDAPARGVYASGRTGWYEHNLYPLRYNKAAADVSWSGCPPWRPATSPPAPAQTIKAVLGRAGLAEGILERPQEVGVFLQVGELTAPLTNAPDVEPPVLPPNDADDVLNVPRPRGHQLVDHQIFRRARDERDAGDGPPHGRPLEHFLFERQRGQRNVQAHTVRGAEHQHAAIQRELSRVVAPRLEAPQEVVDERGLRSERREHGQVGVAGEAGLAPSLDGQAPDHARAGLEVRQRAERLDGRGELRRQV
jgi:hypothetical protein